jgi:hypothetical protein
MIRKKSYLAGILTSAMLISALALPGVASASAKGRKNTTLALGAITAYELLKGKTTNALIAGAATAYAYKKYDDARKDEKRKDRHSRWTKTVHHRRTVVHRRSR